MKAVGTSMGSFEGPLCPAPCFSVVSRCRLVLHCLSDFAGVVLLNVVCWCSSFRSAISKSVI